MLATAVACSANTNSKKESSTTLNAETSKQDYSIDKNDKITETEKEVKTIDTITESTEIEAIEKVEKAENYASEITENEDSKLESNNNNSPKKLEDDKGVETVQTNPEPEPVKGPVAYSPSHSGFNALLAKYVSATGKVNYDGFKTEKSKLDEYIKLLAENSPTEKWTKNEKLAYWINLYNAATIQLILKNYPVKSIMNINNGKAWDLKFVKSGDKTLTLNQIENEIIRPTFKDARIHFALNCAAQSCPKLLNAAFYAHILDKQLDTATKKFINNSVKNQISENSVKISKIFEWYAVDFGEQKGLIDYLNKYSNTNISSKAKISFIEYNWDLNK